MLSSLAAHVRQFLYAAWHGHWRFLFDTTHHCTLHWPVHPGTITKWLVHADGVLAPSRTFPRGTYKLVIHLEVHPLRSARERLWEFGNAQAFARAFRGTPLHVTLCVPSWPTTHSGAVTLLVLAADSVAYASDALQFRKPTLSNDDDASWTPFYECVDELHMAIDTEMWATIEAVDDDDTVTLGQLKQRTLSRMRARRKEDAELAVFHAVRDQTRCLALDDAFKDGARVSAEQLREIMRGSAAPDHA